MQKDCFPILARNRGSGDVRHDLWEKKEKKTIDAPDPAFYFSVCFLNPILHLKKEVKKPDYEQKGVGKTPPTISCCILHF